jgi:hypothetical protein
MTKALIMFDVLFKRQGKYYTVTAKELVLHVFWQYPTECVNCSCNRWLERVNSIHRYLFMRQLNA